MGKNFWVIKKRNILELCFFLYILGSYTVPMMGWNNIFLQAPLYLFVIFTWLTLLVKYGNLDQRFFWWYLLFVVFCLFSILYSVSFSASTEMVSYLVTAFALGISFYVFLEYETSYRVIKYSYILVSIIVGAYLISNFSQAHWWSRLGESFGMNENMVALYFLIPLCFAISEIYESRAVILNLIAIGISLIVILLSGSKKALFAVFIYGVVFYLLKSNGIGKKAKIIIMSIIAIFIAYQVIMKIPLLYNIMGYRLEAMFETFQTNSFGNVGSSTAERGDMIRYGFKFLLASPLFGHGINSFKELYGAITNHYAYAHNNYIEILTDLGIIGFLLYYSLHFSIIKRITCMDKRMRQYYADMIAFICVILFFDIAMVTYYDTRIILILSIVFKKIVIESPFLEKNSNNLLF